MARVEAVIANEMMVCTEAIVVLVAGGGRDGTAQKTAITSVTMSVVGMMMKAMEAEERAQRQQKQ